MDHPLRLLAAACAVSPIMLLSSALQAAPRSKAVALEAAATNDATRTLVIRVAAQRGPSVLRVQILLDRAHFSPGEIDGRFGSTTRGAVAAFNAARKIKAGANVTAETWKILNLDVAPAIVPYTLTAEDLAGPFSPIPAEMAGKAKLPALGYENLAEALGEKFHISPGLLATLNAGKTLDRAGVIIQVPNVARPPLEKMTGMTIRVSRKRGSVEAIDRDGGIVARYPATTGSEHDPLPLGNWKINGVAWNPPYNYNPALFWDAEPAEKKAKLAPGPNSPVGPVWIDLSKPHYGIHGTPVPSTIGKTSSHGCIRLTNWDAIELAKLVTPGMPAVLGE